VADGTCQEASECAGLAHDDCEGLFTCAGGACRWTCLGETACRTDGECVMVDRGCCCGFGPDEYVAIHADLVDEWRNRPECWAVDCPAITCEPPEDMWAACVDGGCLIEIGPPQDECLTDADCVKVPGDCCGCEFGGLEASVPADERDAYLAELEDVCSVIDPFCGGYDACTDREAVCHAGLCVLDGAWCDCPQGVDDWDPVCGGTGARMLTLPNACVAECLDIPWSYPGRCDCMVDCYVGDWVCAENHQTYGCGEWEAACNGQAVLYPAPCSDECDQCLMLGRPSIPVCSEDFRDFSDMCFADCQELGWWHTGACLEGEGYQCGGIAGILCPSDELACIYEAMIPDAQGRCVQLGSCQEPVHCEYQPLAHDDCDGAWTCPDHTCTWQCG